MWSARKESTPRSTRFGFRPLAWVMVMFLPQASFGSDGVAACVLFCRSHWHAAIDAPVRRRPAVDLTAVTPVFAIERRNPAQAIGPACRAARCLAWAQVPPI